MKVTRGAVVSRDGVRIACETSGSGPALVVVGAALADRDGTRRLCRCLAERFAVVNYDRRGRGESGDQAPYAVGREVQDIEALIDACGGSAFVFGSSSGAALALDAAAALGGRVAGVLLYEPPFLVDDSRPAMPADLSERVSALVAAGRRDDAVKLFFRAGMGIPAFAVHLMRWLMPGWSKMARAAHTIAYDLVVLEGTQSGAPLSPDRWSGVSAPTLVAVGSRSETFFHTGAQALASSLPDSEYRSVPGLDHGAVLMAPRALAALAGAWFLDRQSPMRDGNSGTPRTPGTTRR